MNIALRRFGAPILSHFCRMLLEAAPIIRFTMGADVAGCARFKRLENQELIQSLQTRWPMSCNPEVLKHVPLFALLDEEETAVLAGQVELKNFAPRQRIYKMGDPGGQAYVMVSGRVRVTTVDEDQQEVIVDEPGNGAFFGFASMLEHTSHQTSATAIEDTQCVEVSRANIATLLQRKPHAGMDMLTVLGRQFHASQQLVRVRAMRNPNDVIEAKETLPERIADSVVQFGGSWTFIIGFLILSSVYTAINVGMRRAAWDPYPFIMMNQNRQDRKDRVRSELDYAVNRRAEAEIQGLGRKLNLLGDQVGDLEDLLRGKSPGGARGEHTGG